MVDFTFRRRQDPVRTAPSCLSRSFATQNQAGRWRAQLSGYGRRRALISSVASSRDYSPRKMVRKFGVRCALQHCSITQLPYVDGPDSNISTRLSVPLLISADHVRTAQPMRPQPVYAYRQTFSSGPGRQANQGWDKRTTMSSSSVQITSGNSRSPRMHRAVA